MSQPPPNKAQLVREYAAKVDFGRTSEDYARHRPGPPPSFYDRVETFAPFRGREVLDIGCGVGFVAIEAAARGACAMGLDPAENQIVQARRLAAEQRLTIDFRTGKAEDTGLPSAAFDFYIASQCWHWFDPVLAGREAMRVLRPGGLAITVAFDYLPRRSPIAAATEEIILRYNPAWPMAGNQGVHIRPLEDLPAAGFEPIEQISWEVLQPFTHEGWRGRMRTCNGVGASLSPGLLEAFDRDLADLLRTRWPHEPIHVEHRVWMVIARRP